MTSRISDTVRWGIIGVGNVCEVKGGPPLYKSDHSELVLVHRRNREAGEDYVKRHGHGRYVSSMEELLASPEVNAVYVASPHALHYEQTIAALNAGKHVLVEKPMASSAKECYEMAKLADRLNLSLGVAYYRRGYPSLQTIQKILSGGDFGPVHSMSINNQFPTSHRLDLVHFLLGEAVQTRILGGQASNHKSESTMDRIEVKMKSGAVASMIFGWAETQIPESLKICGEKQSIYLYDLKQGLLVREKEGVLEQIFTGGLEHTHTGLVENFVDHLRNGTPLLCDGLEGSKSTSILDALELCNSDGSWKDL